MSTNREPSGGFAEVTTIRGLIYRGPAERDGEYVSVENNGKLWTFGPKAIYSVVWRDEPGRTAS